MSEGIDNQYDFFKKVNLDAEGNLGVSIEGGTEDTNAIHVNVASEISGVASKGVPTTSDFLLIEDVSDSNNKKKITIGDLPSSAPSDPRTVSTVSTATLIIDSSTTDQSIITAQAEGLTIGVPTGTPVEGRKLIIRIKDDGTNRALTWNAIFEVIGVTLPTTTTANKTIYVGLIYNGTSTKWDVIAVKEQA